MPKNETTHPFVAHDKFPQMCADCGFEEGASWHKTTRGLWWLLRWHVARWLIHTGLKVAPDGHAKDRVSSALWAAGNHMRAVIQNGR